MERGREADEPECLEPQKREVMDVAGNGGTSAFCGQMCFNVPCNNLTIRFPNFPSDNILATKDETFNPSEGRGN